VLASTLIDCCSSCCRGYFSLVVSWGYIVFISIFFIMKSSISTSTNLENSSSGSITPIGFDICIDSIAFPYRGAFGKNDRSF
jgi:hypothetical protein